MKAERRHELKQNSLAKGLENLPVLISIHLNKILLGLIFVALLVLLIQYRMNSSRQARAQAVASMADVRAGVQRAQLLSFGVGNPEEIARNRATVLNEVDSLITTIYNDLSDSADASLRAEALVARGDLYWHLANSTILPGSTTRPALELPRKRSELFEQAAGTYEAVVKNYPDQVLSHASALIGLAVIAETRNDTAGARARYQAILDNPKLAGTFGPFAKQRIDDLDLLKGRVLLGAYGDTAPATPTPLLIPPTTGPSAFPTMNDTLSAPPITLPGEGPSTAPTTAPSMTAPSMSAPSMSAPTTAPTTAPSMMSTPTPEMTSPGMSTPTPAPTTSPAATPTTVPSMSPAAIPMIPSATQGSAPVAP